MDDEPLGALALVHALRRLGLRVVAMAPLVNDAVEQAGVWVSPRLERLRRAGSFGLPGAALSPYVLPRAPSSAGAAQDPGRRVEAQAVVETYQVLSTWADAVVVESAGGLEELLSPHLAVHEVAGRLALPLVLTLRPDADAPRRACRALALARASDVPLAGWLLTGSEPAADPVVGLLTARLGSAPLGALPADASHVAEAAAHIDLHALSRALHLPRDVLPPGALH